MLILRSGSSITSFNVCLNDIPLIVDISFWWLSDSSINCLHVVFGDCNLECFLIYVWVCTICDSSLAGLLDRRWKLSNIIIEVFDCSKPNWIGSVGTWSTALPAISWSSCLRLLWALYRSSCCYWSDKGAGNWRSISGWATSRQTSWLCLIRSWLRSWRWSLFFDVTIAWLLLTIGEFSKRPTTAFACYFYPRSLWSVLTCFFDFSFVSYMKSLLFCFYRLKPVSSNSAFEPSFPSMLISWPFTFFAFCFLCDLVVNERRFMLCVPLGRVTLSIVEVAGGLPWLSARLESDAVMRLCRP